MEFKIGDKITSKLIGVYIVKTKHEPFKGVVDVKTPLLLVYDNNIEQERYISVTDYKYIQRNYDYSKNVNVIERGFFLRKMDLSEEYPRFDIENVETGEIITHCYLYNGSWTHVN